MLTVEFSNEGRAVLDRCLQEPYPAPGDAGQLKREIDPSGRTVFVLTDVPRGLDPDVLFERVADDARSGLIESLQNIHNESNDLAPIRLVFTPRVDADIDRVPDDLFASFERTRSSATKAARQLRARVAGQGIAVTLSHDDWYGIHCVVADARSRRPSDVNLDQVGRLIQLSLFGPDSADRFAVGVDESR